MTQRFAFSLFALVLALQPVRSQTICPTKNPSSSGLCVLTGQYNNARQGLNAYEPTLGGYASALSNFGLIRMFQTDPTDYYAASGTTSNPVMAQPLWLNSLPIGGGTYDVMIMATLNDTIYAFDADGTGAGAGTALWKRNATSTNPALYLNCGTAGTPVTGSPGGLPYYGIVSTPVIDTTETTDPVMFVVSGCNNATAGTNQWYLNIIDVITGTDLIPPSAQPAPAGGILINGDADWHPDNELQRPALLLVHSGGNTYIYFGFGAAANELAAASNSHHGYLMGYQITYSGSGPASVTAAPLPASPFNVTPSDSTSNVFPPTSSHSIPPPPGAGLGPLAYPSCASSGTESCYEGDDWVSSEGHGGGVWMSGKGAAADSNGSVYFATGNGAFDCSSKTSSCAASPGAPGLLNYSEALVELGPASMKPYDFFAPFVNRVASDTGLYPPASHQTQALNRYDLDFGSAGALLLGTTLNGATQTWVVSADKSGYGYVMPTSNTTASLSSGGLGQFQAGEAGLTNGSYTTQLPFQVSRGSAGCPTQLDSDHYTNTTTCDQIMGLAFWNNFLFAWPVNEPVVAYHGVATQGAPSVSDPDNYQFSTRLDPCPAPSVCSSYPAADYPGGNMAIAANAAGKATLWASGRMVSGTQLLGELIGYAINENATTGTGLLTPIFNSGNAKYCSSMTGSLGKDAWIPSSFAQPTLAHGNVSVALSKARTTSGADIAGGVVLVFGTCP
jgi:hypothetical protein